jgi:hypothetical protein
MLVTAAVIAACVRMLTEAVSEEVTAAVGAGNQDWQLVVSDSRTGHRSTAAVAQPAAQHRHWGVGDLLFASCMSHHACYMHEWRFAR